MLLDIHFSWTLVLIDVVLYVILQTCRIWADVILPQHWFDPSHALFRTRPWELEGRFYQRYFHIRHWKDKLPTVDGCNHFSKRSLDSKSPEYLRRFIFETCRAESHHLRSILETTLFLIWNPPWLFIIIWLISLSLHLPCIFVQRYNRPRMQKVLEQISQD